MTRNRRKALARIQPIFENYFHTVADRLRALRVLNGFTQQFLADKVGLASGSTISRIEGGFGLPSARTLIRLAEYCGFSSDYLLGFSENAQLESKTKRRTA